MVKSETRLYHIWNAMRGRCLRDTAENYHNYGGRGIKICEPWNNFEVFKLWAESNGYSDSLTIERKDNNLNYTPENCTWVDMHTQRRNKRTNKMITYNGITLCITDWADIVGIKRTTIDERLKRGWDVKKALYAPIDKRFRRN